MRTYISQADARTLRTLTNAPLLPRPMRTLVGVGITASTYTYLDGVRAIVKDSGERHEVAAYLVSTVFPGLVHVPPTVLRHSDADAREVSVQAWIENTHRLTAYSDITRSETLGLATFDWIIANADRHFGNFLQAGRTLYPIDHGYAFDRAVDTRGPIGYVAGTRIPAYLHSHVDRLLSQEFDVRAMLRPYISEQTISAMFARAVTFQQWRSFPQFPRF